MTSVTERYERKEEHWSLRRLDTAPLDITIDLFKDLVNEVRSGHCGLAFACNTVINAY